MELQWNLSIKDTLNEAHLSVQDSQLGPKAVLYSEIPLYLTVNLECSCWPPQTNFPQFFVHCSFVQWCYNL